MEFRLLPTLQELNGVLEDSQQLIVDAETVTLDIEAQSAAGVPLRGGHPVADHL
jgi:hypothetical protein